MQLMSRLSDFNPTLGNPYAFVLQCAGRTAELRPLVEDVLQMSCAITIGDVFMRGAPIFAFDIEKFPELGKTGNYHVWLTVESGEIVDLTLMASLYLHYGKPVEEASPIAGLPDEISGFVWHPALVGDEALNVLLSASMGLDG
ncbi:hypothetical protein DF154_19540 [Burkholderia ubonensis]|nr:hypothetical protein DF154_19540 [Burkholderia ubonensis]